MNVRTLVYLVVILMVINIAALATIIYERTASRWEPVPGPDAPPALDPGQSRLPRALGLTHEQQDALRDSRRRLAEMMKDIQEEINAKRQLLIAEIGKSEPDTAYVYQLVEEIGKLQTEVQRRAVANILKDGSILDARQRELLLHQIEDRAYRRARQMFEDRRDGRRGRH